MSPKPAMTPFPVCSPGQGRAWRLIHSLPRISNLGACWDFRWLSARNAHDRVNDGLGPRKNSPEWFSGLFPSSRVLAFCALANSIFQTADGVLNLASCLFS
jgi:hypothetical protein